MTTVYHNGSALMLDDDVADRLGHHAGKQLTEAETWEAIAANATAAIARCEAEIARLRRTSPEKD